MTTPVAVLPVVGTVAPELLAGMAELKALLVSLGATSEEAGRKAQRGADGISSAGASAQNALTSLTLVSFAYNEITSAIDRVLSTIGGIAALAGEQDRLSAQAAELGLNFDAAAEAAGIFSDEVDALGAAATFANADIRLTQQELNALERVAGANAARLGISVTQSVETLTQALIRGRESGLQRYGQELAAVAGGAHSVGERLQVLVRVAGNTTLATDNSASAFARLTDRLDDYKRTAASAFSDELSRLLSLGEGARTTSEDVANLSSAFAGLARDISTVVAMAIGGIRFLVTGLVADIAHLGNIVGLVSNDTARALRRAQADSLENLEAQQAEREGETGTIYRGLGRSDPLVSGARQIDWTHERGRALETRVRTTGTVTSDPVPPRRREGVSYQPRAQAEADARRIAEADASARDARRPDEADASARDARDRDATKHANARAGASRAAAEATKEEAAKLAEIADAHARAAQETQLRARAERDAAEAAARSRASVDALIAAEERRSLDAKRLDGEMTNLSNERRRAAEDAAKLGDSKEVREADSTLTMFARNVESIEAVFARVGDTTHAFFRALIDDSLSAGDALQKWVHDSLSALSEVASREAIMSLGKGLSALFTNPPAAAAHFAAAAAFGAVAIGAGAAAGAIGSPQASAASASAGGTSRRTGSDRASNDNADVAPIVYNYYAPVIGGREATDGEVGTRLERFDARARRRMAA